MNEPFRLTLDGMKAWNSLPAHYHPRLHRLPPT